MKITESLIEAVHRIVNEKLYKEYPCFGMADISEHPEGSIKLWEIGLVSNSYHHFLFSELINCRTDEWIKQRNIFFETHQPLKPYYRTRLIDYEAGADAMLNAIRAKFPDRESSIIKEVKK